MYELRSSDMGTPPFVIITQGLENYGAPRCGDPDVLDNHPHWKLKGGETYIVKGLDRMQDAIAYIQFHKCNVNDGWIEHVSKSCTLEEWIAEFEGHHDQLANELNYCKHIDVTDGIHSFFNNKD
jgi:hypothetical protein